MPHATILDNKMEQLSPIPTKAMMKAQRSKSAQFWHH